MPIKTEEYGFVVRRVKLYGLHRNPLYHEEHLYYFQNLFVRGEFEETIPYIKICDRNLSEAQVRDENNNFLINILNVVDSNTLPDYDETESYDSEKFMLHGADAKVLIFCGEIVAIGNCNNECWIPTENFFKGIEANNFNKFKKELVENRICECEKEIKSYLNSGLSNSEKYLKSTRILNVLTKTEI